MCQLFAGQPRENYESQTRSLRLNGQSTSIRLETTFWRILDNIADSQGFTTPRFVSKLHSEVMAIHGEVDNFSSLLRCTCVVHLEKQSMVGLPAREPISGQRKGSPPEDSTAAMATNTLVAS